MQGKRRVLPLVLFLVTSLAHATGTAGAATGDQAPRGGPKPANDGTYAVTTSASTCSDGLSKTKASSLTLTVEGQKVSLVGTGSASSAPPKTGELLDDGSFTISSTLSDGGTVTVTGTISDGHVEGTWNYAFGSGLKCSPSLSGDRVGAEDVSPGDELIDEFGLEEIFEEYEDYCDGRLADCPTLEQSASDTADTFEDLFCPEGGCNQKGLSRYQRALPDLIFRAQLLAGAGKRFPSIKAMLPVLTRMAFHGATDSDPATARQAASAAWRLFATVAKIDYVSPTL